jgi:cytochrome P450
MNSLSWLYDWFAGYIDERRVSPKNDVLTQLAQAVYPDGSLPEVMAVAHMAAVLFASGGETTARLLSTALV